jgi:ABC-type polysaccharide/polyol phosphate transport system ATPase subunit
MKDIHDFAIEVTHVSKRYEIHHEKPTLAEKIIQRRNETFWALKDINLVIKKGEKIGIIGLNGSGKTTLLKIITGITTPTSGSVTSQGKIVSLIDLEAGFHDDLTGEQNIYLNGMLLGMKKKEIQANFRRIVNYADIGTFINAPLFTYSSGMKLRLGFSVAVHAKPDILILDEGIAVGDENFQKKARATIEKFYQSKKTIVIVSHWMSYLKENCSKIIWINQGKVYKNGGVNLLDQYAKKW